MNMNLLAAACLLASCGAGPTSTPISTPTSADLQRVELLDEFCGAPAEKCDHLASRIVDFDAGVVQRHACVEGVEGVDGGSQKWGALRGDTIDSHALTASQLVQVREAVERLQFSSQHIGALDGAMTAVLLTTASKGTQTSSPGATCGSDPYQKVVRGYAELRAVVDGL